MGQTSNCTPVNIQLWPFQKTERRLSIPKKLPVSHEQKKKGPAHHGKAAAVGIAALALASRQFQNSSENQPKSYFEDSHWSKKHRGQYGFDGP